MWIHNIDPVLLSLGPLEIRYYGLFYALGFVFAYFFMRHAIKKKQLPFTEKELDTFLMYLIIGVVLGARVFEVIFYNLQYYFSNPLKIVAIWQGGLSFHGGLVGAFVAVYVFCRKQSIHWLQLADILAIPAALALMIGRIGNFINGELYGRVTSVSWAMKFPGAEGWRHPSQLYEAFKNLLIVITLLILKQKPRKHGVIFGTFLVMYGVLRFTVEFVREPEVLFGWITMGQLLSIPVAIVGLWLIYKK